MSDANTRPTFYAPFPAGTRVTLKSYRGHNPDHEKMDIYAAGWPSVVASAPGLVHEHFDPGGIEIRHFIPGTRRLGNWFTTYMHMSDRVAVGTVVAQGQRVGTAGSVGTGVKHLHHEQLHDQSPNGDADTGDMVYPAFHEYNGNKPFSMPLGEPGISFTSQNKKGASSGTSTSGSSEHKLSAVHQGAPVPSIIRKGSGQYFGLITGPAASHGGYYENERKYVKMIQQRLIWFGFVPGTRDINSSFASGKFDAKTKAAVTRFQQRYMVNTQYWGQIWYDDWTRLFNL